MASRLEEDETQGQSKWADLDDDDDDWAPEAITWTDGTKTTLPHPDDAPPPPPAVSVPEPIKEAVLETPKSPAAPVSTPTPVPKPVGLPSGRGLKLKNTPQERPTLVAKPPAQAQAIKSPWASLPPVEKAPPVALETPLSASRAPAREALSQKSTTHSGPMMPPPREFAADDFSRSGWRDGSSNAGRELYNSQSGRYEPVTDRRGSLRPDQSKQPHLLQRPTQEDQPGPSSAFQTHRTSQDGHFARRRASSNVSGGSGSYYRSIKGHDGQMPPPDHLGARRPSIAGSIESVTSPSQVPAVMHGQARYQHGQPGVPSHISPRAHFANPNQAGPPGPSGSPSSLEPHVANAVPQHPQLQTHQPQPSPDEVEYQKKLMRERNEIARKRRHEQEAAEEAARRERIQKKLDALGPAPKKKSEKPETAAPDTIRPTHIQQRDESGSGARGVQGSPPDRQAAPETGAQTSGASHETTTPSTAGPAKPNVHATPPTRRMSQGQDSKQPDMWTGTGPRPERFTSWVPGAQPPIRNVWGSPNNDRGLGNGTFNPELVRVPGSTADPSQPGKGPSPIAPPSVIARTPSQDQAPQPQAPIGSRPRFDQPATLANRWVSAVHDGDKKINASRLAERLDRDRQLAEHGLTIEDAQPAIKDTWRQVNVPGDGTRRKMPPADTNQHGPWQAPVEDLAKNSAKDAPAAPHAGVIGAPSQPRPSRFFPSRDVRNESYALPEPSRPQSPSPPPPTMEDHPAYEGDVAHPHVSLPRPQPVVKLPPAMGAPATHNQRSNGNVVAQPSHRDTARQAPQTHNTARRASEVKEKDWQQRFDNLLGNAKLSPPKAMVVDPASRHALDDPIHRDGATVSLPGRVQVSIIDVIKDVTSKPMAEECFDEPEIGSLPQVRVPHTAPEALWHPAGLHAKPLPKRFVVHALAMEPFQSSELTNTGNFVYIHFPGMPQGKSISIPFTAGRGARGSRGGGRGRGNRGSSRREVSRSREPKEPSPGHTGRGNSRGNFRSRGSENWTRAGAAKPSLQA